MRNLTALLFLLSLCSLHLVFSAPTGLDHNTQCCAETTTTKIPRKNIVSYLKTRNDCPKKAIVFKILNVAKNTDRTVCVDPRAPWVEGHMKAVDLKKQAPTPYEFKDHCCSTTTKAEIPVKDIVTCQWTCSSCPISAIIFETKDRRKTCVDPEAPWLNIQKTVNQNPEAQHSMTFNTNNCSMSKH